MPEGNLYDSFNTYLAVVDIESNLLTTKTGFLEFVCDVSGFNGGVDKMICQ